MSEIVAVIFDWAGTMIDFGCMAPVKALQAAFAAEGIALDAGTARKDMGRAKRDHVSAILADPAVVDPWIARHGKAPGEADVARIYTCLEPLMVAEAEAAAVLIDGAAATAGWLRGRDIKIGSGTGYTRQMMAPILKAAAAQGYMPDVVVCAGETKAGRPSPLPMWKALVELGAYPAHRCVKVDDAPVGIQEGVSAGGWTVGLAASGNETGLSASDWQALDAPAKAAKMARAEAALRAAGAHYVIPSVADLPGVIGMIEVRIAAGGRP